MIRLYVDTQLNCLECLLQGTGLIFQFRFIFIDTLFTNETRVTFSLIKLIVNVNHLLLQRFIIC